MLPDGFVKSVFASNAGLKSHSSPGEAHDSATKSTWTDSAAIERRQMKNGPLTELELIEEAICRYYEYLGRREAAYVLAHLVEDHDEYENALPQWLRDWFKDRQNNDPCASQALHWDFREWAAAETGNSNWDKCVCSSSASSLLPLELEEISVALTMLALHHIRHPLFLSIL